MNAIRIERRLTWEQLTTSTGIGRATFARYAQGARTAFPDVMRVMDWLDEPAAAFTYAAER